MALLSVPAEKRSFLGVPLIIHRYIFVGSLILLVVGMPTSTFLTSLPQFIMLGNWLLEGNLKDKMRRFFNNKPALVLCSFFLMHVIGLLYTSTAGMDYGMEDVRKKIPLFLLPLIFSTTDILTDKERKTVILFFVLSVTFATLYGSYLLITRQFTDIREISTFVDPVRQAMMQVLCFFLLIYYVFTNKLTILSIALLILAVWMVVYLFIMQSLTCVIMTVVISIVLLLVWAYRQIRQKNTWRGLSVFLVAVLCFVGSIGYLAYFKGHYFPKPEKVDFTKLDKVTPGGNPYSNYPEDYLTENGYYVYINICWPELTQAWNTRSNIPFEGFDNKGNLIRYTAIRYLASKGFKKDADGVKQLSQDDIHAIEMGIPNYKFNSLTSMSYRLYQVFWELRDYEHGGSANGHSLTQRFEFWRAATGIIKQHWLAGVGTGNVRIAFSDQYDAMHSTLSKDSRLRSHNQYLEIGVAFGIIGLVWFVINLFYPPFKTAKIYSYSYFIFWMILMIAILTEDTLETQAGATFYAFFNAFFLFL